jgi:transposase
MVETSGDEGRGLGSPPGTRRLAQASHSGRALLEKLSLAPWASRRRQELLELLDRMNPTIEELTAAAEREAKKRPEVLRLMTHPGVGPLIPFRSSMVFDDNLLTM